MRGEREREREKVRETLAGCLLIYASIGDGTHHLGM